MDRPNRWQKACSIWLWLLGLLPVFMTIFVYFVQGQEVIRDVGLGAFLRTAQSVFIPNYVWPLQQLVHGLARSMNTADASHVLPGLQGFLSALNISVQLALPVVGLGLWQGARWSSRAFVILFGLAFLLYFPAHVMKLIASAEFHGLPVIFFNMVIACVAWLPPIVLFILSHRAKNS